MLLQQSRASPFSTAAQLHENWLTENPVSTRTVHRILSSDGLRGCISAQKPALTKRQLKKRVAFAKAHSLEKGWSVEKWQKVDFSDESTIALHSNRHKYCRRPVGTRMDPRFTQKTVKFHHGLGLHSVWGSARDLQSGWEHQQPKIPRNSCSPLHSKQKERPNCTA